MEKGANQFMFDLGSNPAITVPMETVEAVLSKDNLVCDYATAFCREAARINPALAQQVQLNEDELREYAMYLLTKRVEIIYDKCPDYRKLKSLYIPGYLQYSLSLIGIVFDRPMGLKLVPVLQEPSQMTFEQALSVSEKIGSFERFMPIFQDAMPRSVEGDAQLMATAMIEGTVRSYKRDVHPSHIHVCRYLGIMLKREKDFRVLYRVQYDDVAFITATLLSNKRVFV